MSRKDCFWWAAFGAVLPEIVRFFRIVAVGEALPHLNWVLYVIFLLLFACCAGVFSVAWKPESAYKAVWIGASLPALVATLVQVAPVIPKTPGT
jgi:hypothetical protein